MRITKDMVDLIHSMDIHASRCSSYRELRGVFYMAKRKLININMMYNLTFEELHSVLDFIIDVYKRERYRLDHE